MHTHRDERYAEGEGRVEGRGQEERRRVGSTYIGAGTENTTYVAGNNEECNCNVDENSSKGFNIFSIWLISSVLCKRGAHP